MKTIETRQIMQDDTHIVGFVRLVEGATGKRFVEIDIISASLDPPQAINLAKAIDDFARRANLWNQGM